MESNVENWEFYHSLCPHSGYTCLSKLVMTLVIQNKMHYFTVLWLIMLHIKELYMGICFISMYDTMASQQAILYFSILFSEVL